MDFAKTKTKRIKNKKGRLSKVLGIILAAAVLFILFIGYSLNRPQKGRSNIVIVTDSLFVLSLDHERKTLTIISIPKNAYLNVAQGKGRLTAASLFKFDLLEKQKGELLTQTVREFLGIPIDGWLKTNSSFKSLTDFSGFQKKEMSLFNLNDLSSEIFRVKTNISPLKLRHFYLDIKKVRGDKINYIDLYKYPVFLLEKLPDDSLVLNADLINLDGILKNSFNEWKILEENFSIKVENGTESPGLAARASRIITNMGGHVIMVGESSLGDSDCQLVTHQENKGSYTVKRINSIFGCKINTKLSDDERSDITIILGRKYKTEVYGSI